MTSKASLLPASCLPITAESLNRGCACLSLDLGRLRHELEAEPELAGLADAIAHSRPHLFAAIAVFISQSQLERMASVVAAVEEVAGLPAYRTAALARAPRISRHDFGPRGVLTGFDFHLTPSGPRLIEINTNAGGALLNAALVRAQQACCQEVMDVAFEPVGESTKLEQTFFEMFAEEWRLQRGNRRLSGRIAIVDDDCAAQYLHPEFLLYQQLFARHRVPALMAEAAELQWQAGQLQHRGQPVDMVYNRLTDFYFTSPSHAALRAAYEAEAVVVTPHPRAHALYADKRNLVMLSDEAALAEMGASQESRAILSMGVPRTELVSPENAEDLWSRRRGLFFKPAAGYGSKAAYRGDKLTHRVWKEILGADYVAQAMVPPSERLVEVDGVQTDLKLDVRAYSYAGKIQLIAARLFQGQTTNFRTEGGGFAPVFVVR